MAKQYRVILTAVVFLLQTGCSIRDGDDESVDQASESPQMTSNEKKAQEVTASGTSASDLEETESTPASSDPSIESAIPDPTIRPIDGGLQIQSLFQIADDYFNSQTEVDIDALELPCPSGNPDGCFHSDRAKPEYDQSNNGIYKGVVTGASSGHILLDIRNDDSDLLMAELSYRDDSFEVPLSEFKRSNGTYEYRFSNSDYDFGLVIAENGEIVRDSAMLYVPGGEVAVVTIAKETSTQLVEVFEGTFDGFSTGLWNTILVGDHTTDGYYREIAAGTGGVAWGEAVSPVTMVGEWQADDIEINNGITFGYRDTDTVWGKWYYKQQTESDISGEWKGVKTL